MDLKITGAKLSGDAEKDVKILANHVFQLEEQLRYQLRNLDVTNFNDLGLARYENGRLQVYAKQVEIQTEKLRLEFGKETDEIYAEISATAEELLAEIESVGGNYTSLSATVEGLAARVGNTEGNYSSLSQTVSGIQTTVKGHTTTINNHTNTLNNHTNSINSHGNSIVSLQSQITQTADKIAAVVSAVDDSSGNVTAASIVAAINNAGSAVKISADHVNIEGNFVTVSDLAGTGKVEINAGNIKAGGVIEGVQVKTAAHKYHGQVYLCENFIQFIGADSDDSSLITNDYGVLTLRSNTVEIEATSPDTPYIKILVDGGYWVISADKIYYVNSFGDVVREANMIEHY